MDPRRRLTELAAERGASLAALSRMIGRNASYLQQFVGKGSPRKLEEEDRRKLADFFAVPETELGAPEDRGEPRGEYVEVPRLPLEASAGPGAAAAQEIAFDSFRFSRRWLREQGLEPGQLSAIRVMGDSMDPLLRDGDEILVDRTPRPFREGVHVVRGELEIHDVASDEEDASLPAVSPESAALSEPADAAVSFRRQSPQASSHDQREIACHAL